MFSHFDTTQNQRNACCIMLVCRVQHAASCCMTRMQAAADCMQDLYAIYADCSRNHSDAYGCILKNAHG